jgi:hypothetical protein
MLIFLDIDGVLRPYTAAREGFDPDCLWRFEEVVREVEAARIVISSDWRLVMPLDAIRELFSAEVAERIVGATPVLQGMRRLNRYREVLAYARAQPAPVSWVAVDDDPWNYPEEAVDVNLLLTDPDRGLDAPAAARLRRLLAGGPTGQGLPDRRRSLERGGPLDP